MMYRDMILVHYHLVDYLGKTISLYMQPIHINSIYQSVKRAIKLNWVHIT